MIPATYRGSQIELKLRKLDNAEGWTAQCILVNSTGHSVILEPTGAYTTPQRAGQAAFTAACKYIDRERRDSLFRVVRSRSTA